MLLDWDVAAIVVLYWSENLVVGFYNLLKMACVGGIRAIPSSAFFLFHYGGFCAVHGMLLINLLLPESDNPLEPSKWPFVLVFIELLLNVVKEVLAQAPAAWVLGFIGLLISHGYSFVANFLGGGEQQRNTVHSLMSAPYKRIVLLHIAIIAGGMAVASLGQPLPLLVILVMLKIAMDVVLHLRERRI